MGEKKIVLEFDEFEIGFILRCMYIGSLAYNIIDGDIVKSKFLDSITNKFYKAVHNNDKKL